jgi:hypothetical protein
MKDDIKDGREFGFGLLEVGMALVVIAFAAAGLSKLLTANADDTVSQWEAVLLEKEPRMLEPADVIEMTGRYLDGVANAPVDRLQSTGRGRYPLCRGGQTYKRGIPLPGYDFSGPDWEPLRNHADRICTRAGELNEWKDRSE